jgi:hypothetical protein
MGKRTEKSEGEEEIDDDEQKHETSNIESILLSDEGKKKKKKSTYFFIIRQTTYVSRTPRPAFFPTTEIEEKRKTIFFLRLVSCLSSILVYYSAE